MAEDERVAFLVYEIDITTNDFDRFLIGLDSSGEYILDFSGKSIFVFKWKNSSSYEVITSEIYSYTHTEDKITLIYPDNEIYNSVKIR